MNLDFHRPKDLLALRSDEVRLHTHDASIMILKWNSRHCAQPIKLSNDTFFAGRLQYWFAATSALAHFWVGQQEWQPIRPLYCKLELR